VRWENEKTNVGNVVTVTGEWNSEIEMKLWRRMRIWKLNMKYKIKKVDNTYNTLQCEVCWQDRRRTPRDIPITRVCASGNICGPQPHITLFSRGRAAYVELAEGPTSTSCSWPTLRNWESDEPPSFSTVLIGSHQLRKCRLATWSVMWYYLNRMAQISHG
jgi:hypothetical protein